MSLKTPLRNGVNKTHKKIYTSGEDKNKTQREGDIQR